jgi:hypothetical protein
VDIRFAALSDFAVVDPQGRFTIVGLFSELYVASFPAQIAAVHVALSFFANASEVGSVKALHIVLQDADGKSLLAMDAQLSVPPPTRKGRPSLLNLCFGIHNLAIPSEGEYQICIQVNGETKSVLEFAALLALAAK